jgi:hypothetical protein
MTLHWVQGWLDPWMRLNDHLLQDRFAVFHTDCAYAALLRLAACPCVFGTTEVTAWLPLGW